MNLFAISSCMTCFFASFASCDNAGLSYTIYINFRYYKLSKCGNQPREPSDCIVKENIRRRFSETCPETQCVDLENYETLIDTVKGCMLIGSIGHNQCMTFEMTECFYYIKVTPEESTENKTTCADANCENVFTTGIISSLEKKISATATDSTTATTATSSNITTASNSKSAIDNTKNLTIALITAFVVASVVIVFLIIVICRLRKRKKLRSSQAKLNVKPYSPMHDPNGITSTKSQNQVDICGSQIVTQSGNHVYDRPEVNDEEIQPYWEPFHNDSAAILPDSRFPYSLASDNDNDGYDTPLGDQVISSFQSPELVQPTDNNADAGDKAASTGTYFVLNYQRNSPSYKAAQNYFELEGGQDKGDATTCVGENPDTANRSGQYSKLGQIARNTDNAYGMTACKTDDDVPRKSSSPAKEESDIISGAPTLSDSASLYCLAQIGHNPNVMSGETYEKPPEGAESTRRPSDHAKTNYSELESSHFDPGVNGDYNSSVPSSSDNYTKLGDVTKTSTNTYNTLNDF